MKGNLLKFFAKSIVLIALLVINTQGLNAQIVITEIMYNPPESGTDSLEYVEIYNAGSSTIDLNGYYIGFGAATRYTFLSSTPFAAGEVLVIGVNAAAIKRQFNLSFTPIQWLSGGLNNNPAANTYSVAIFDGSNVVQDIVNYDDASPWPTSPDGSGTSLSLCDPTSDNTVGSNWVASTANTGVTVNTFTLYGSPGVLETCSTCTSPTISAITGNSAICANQILNLGSTLSGTAPFTYTWTGAGTLATPNASATAITGATSGDYTLTVQNACGTASSVVTATVNALPTISVTASAAAVCAGSSATLTASGTATSYTWSTGDATPAAIITPTASPVSSYTVIGTDANNCSATSIETITVNAPTISVNSAAVCTGSSATLTASGTSTAYVWSTSDNTTSIVVTPTNSPVSYTVTGTDANNCSAQAVATVTVNALPTISVNSAAICTGNSATLTATGTSTAYAWSTSDNTASIVVTPTNSPVSYTVTGTDANNCSAEAIATVTVNTLPVVTLNLTSINLQCVSINSVALTGASPAGGTYTGTAVTAGDFSPATAGVGTYTITYTYTDGNSCSNSASDVITVDACTGIQTLNAESFTIYPNPTNGLVVVKSPVLNAQITVFDINGKKVVAQTASSFETQIDLSDLANGVYQLNIVSEGQSINHKVMINK